MPSEFDLIARYFNRPSRNAILGVGDDAALIRPAPGMELAISTDMLVAGRHFFADADPEKLGHKALAVNLSDLAAMGAAPRWVLLALALPEADEAWLAGFSKGFFALAEQFGVDLVGGDTTRGPLNISVTILGEVESGRALRRDGALLGDDIWVSGELGGAALGLRHLMAKDELNVTERERCLERLHTPMPRVALGRALLGVATAAIDISDGLLADLGHILERSGSLGADIELCRLPASPAVANRLPSMVTMACLLAGGDDYELCFTSEPERRGDVLAAADLAGIAVSRIGRITSHPELRVVDTEGRSLDVEMKGYDHFTA